jgi:UrcA family protein
MKITASITTFAAALIAASLAAAPSPAVAQPGGPQGIVVRHADLDLTTSAGRATLDLRVLHAARTACGTPSPADPRGRAKAEQCVAEARAAALAQRDTAIAAALRQAQPVLASSR